LLANNRPDKQQVVQQAVQRVDMENNFWICYSLSHRLFGVYYYTVSVLLKWFCVFLKFCTVVHKHTTDRQKYFPYRQMCSFNASNLFLAGAPTRTLVSLRHSPGKGKKDMISTPAITNHFRSLAY